MDLRKGCSPPKGLFVQDLTLAGQAGIARLHGVGLAAFRAEDRRAALLFPDMLPVDLHARCRENPRAGVKNLAQEFLLVLFLLRFSLKNQALISG